MFRGTCSGSGDTRTAKITEVKSPDGGEWVSYADLPEDVKEFFPMPEEFETTPAGDSLTIAMGCETLTLTKQ
jgi:hypothetical protein